MKRHTVKLFSLITGLALSLAAFFAVTVFSASAESYSAVNIFTTSVGASYDNTESNKNVTYEMGEESTVAYRKNLALKWFERGDADAVGTAKYFTTTIAFVDQNFSKFSMKLEAAQHTMNKEEKSVNTLTFEADSDAYKVYVNDKKDDAVAVTATGGEFVIALTEAAIDGKPALDGTTGEFYVTVNGAYAGTFTNIGSNYAEYNSTSLTPLTFSLDEMKEGAGDKQKIEIRKLNNQKMELKEGKIVDDAAPIFVLNDEVKVLKLGDTLDFDYKNIDVLDSSVSTEFYSFVFKGTDTDKKPDETAEDDADKGLYYKKSDTLSKVVFMENDLYNNTDNAYVSVAFRLSDGDVSDFYYLEDYALSAKVGSSAKEYVRVSKKVDSRPVYATGASADYQKAVTAASRNDKDESIQIGSGAYYYLPSLRSLISDADCGYTELSFDVYYKNQTTESGSATGLSYNELKFEIATAGKYEFKVVAKNKFGNVMQYTKDGKAYNVTSSNVWDVKEIPSFTFDVYNNGPSIEESDINDLGYIDVTFTFPAFEIVGLSGYSSEYKLFRLEGDSSSLTLEQVNSDPDKYTWKEIDEYDSSKDEDEGDNVYEWRPSSRSFIPQEKGFYKITVKVVDSDRLTAESHQVVNVTSEVDTVHGETYWLRDNVLSVVFMAIGGLCLIGIIVLLVIKPKEDAEVVSVKKTRKEELKEKREKRNKK